MCHTTRSCISKQPIFIFIFGTGKTAYYFVDKKGSKIFVVRGRCSEDMMFYSNEKTEKGLGYTVAIFRKQKSSNLFFESPQRCW